MLPTFSINNNSIELSKRAVNEVIENKGLNNYNSFELEAIASFIVKKADGEISEGRSLKSFIYNYRRDIKKAYKNKVLFSDIDCNSENNSNTYLEALLGFEELNDEQFDLDWAINTFLEVREYICFSYGVDLVRLLSLGIKGDSNAVRKLKWVLKKLKVSKDFKKFSYDDITYSLGLILLDPYCSEAIRTENLNILKV